MRRHRSSAGVLVSLVLAAGLGVGVGVGAGGGPSAGADPGAGASTEAARIPDRSHAYGSKRARTVVERREIGRSVQDRPIHAYRMGNPHARHTALLLGQMHGDEPAGPRTVRAIRDRLRVDSDVNLWIVPTMNPDGAERGTRKNARGVDLNRNWPTSGWAAADRSPSSSTYRGRAAGSEPEVRAMMRFLDRTKPALIASVHQPLYAVGRNHKTPGFVDRLARRLDLPARDLGVGTPSGRISPTLTGWYNDRHPGGAVTVEYGARPSDRYVTHTAAHGLMHSVLAHW